MAAWTAIACNTGRNPVGGHLAVLLFVEGGRLGDFVRVVLERLHLLDPTCLPHPQLLNVRTYSN